MARLLPGARRSRPALLGILARRLGQGLIVVAGAAAISFGLAHATGSPAEVLSGGLLTPEQVEQFNHRLGYDRSLGEQVVDYFSGVASGDFGTSIRHREPAMGVVLDALPYTAVLVGVAILFAAAVAVPVAALSVLRRGGRLERLVRGILVVLQGFPEFWLALLLVLVFSTTFHVFPSLGADSLASVVLPALAIGIPLISTLVRMLRTELLDVTDSDLATALRGRGLTEREIVWRHAMRNSIAPFLAILALQIGSLIGGTLVVEAVFAWPGIGTLAIDSVRTRDLPVLQALVVTVAVAYVLLNLVVDLVAVAIDPRKRGRRH